MSKVADIQRRARELCDEFDRLSAEPGSDLSANHSAMATELRRLFTRAQKTMPLRDHPPKMKQATQRLWTCMRKMPVFTMPELEAVATTKTKSVNKFLIALREARYVRVVKHTTFEAGDYTQYELIEDTGPHAPRLRADGKSIYDCNLKKEVPREAGLAGKERPK